MIRIFDNPNYDIIGKRKYAFILSGALILIGIIFMIVKGPKYGIDFTGGTLIQIHVEQPVDIAKIRQAVADAGITSAEIQDFGSPQDFIIKYKEDIDASVVTKAIEKHLGLKVRLDRDEKVGPKVGNELRKKATNAVIIGLLLMLIYITIRFDFAFGLGSVLALFHDVFITLTIFSLFGKEITIEIVAALLTIVGYSINDSIVVSDRVREKLKMIGKSVRLDHFIELVNRGINETLSRTIITSVTTLLVLLSVLIFGGPVIFDFAFALTIGVIVGTYSSIYVVAALVVEWKAYQERRRIRKSRVSATPKPSFSQTTVSTAQKQQAPAQPEQQEAISQKQQATKTTGRKKARKSKKRKKKRR